MQLGEHQMAHLPNASAWKLAAGDKSFFEKTLASSQENHLQSPPFRTGSTSPRSLIQHCCMASKSSKSPSRSHKAMDASPRRSRSAGARISRPVSIVGIGGSAGGLEAFREFFSGMPPDSGLAFVLIPHLDPTNKSIMSEILARSTSMPVAEAREGTLIRANMVYVIPPNRALGVEKGRLKVVAFTEPRGRRTPIDCFLEELGKDQGTRAIAIILSGMGSDGSHGIKTVKENFGLILAQAPSSARYASMPQSAIDTGVVDYIAPVRELPGKLMAYVKTVQQHSRKPVYSDRVLGKNLTRIFALVRGHTHHDFSLYKKSTIHRRIERRMHLHGITSAIK